MNYGTHGQIYDSTIVAPLDIHGAPQFHAASPRRPQGTWLLCSAEQDLAEGFTLAPCPLNTENSRAELHARFLVSCLCLVAGETSTTPEPRSQFKVRTFVSVLVRARVIGQGDNSIAVSCNTDYHIGRLTLAMLPS